MAFAYRIPWLSRLTVTIGEITICRLNDYYYLVRCESPVNDWVKYVSYQCNAVNYNYKELLYSLYRHISLTIWQISLYSLAKDRKICNMTSFINTIMIWNGFTPLSRPIINFNIKLKKFDSSFANLLIAFILTWPVWMILSLTN